MLPDSNHWLQSLQSFDAPELLRFDSVEQLRSILHQEGVQFAEGLATIYLPPQEHLIRTLGSIVEAYPPGSGFKIVKRFEHPQQAQYLDGRGRTTMLRSMGSIYTQAGSAACLSALNLGPHLFDVAHLRAGCVDLTIFVTEHVMGRAPEEAEYHGFLGRLRQLKSEKVFELANPSGLDCGDFYLPTCNGNLFISQDGAFRYVDPQMFLFDFQRVLSTILDEAESVLHFGDRFSLINRGVGFLYQEVPGMKRIGKRATEFRTQKISALLRRHGVALTDRLVFDVCCNAGMMTLSCLAAGASWGIGWDLPEVASRSKKILQVLGGGRVTIQGAQLSEDYCFAKDVPPWLRNRNKSGVLLFLAAWQHIGVPHDVGKIDWEWAIFEGHGNDEPHDTERVVEMMCQRWCCTEVARETVKDGISPRQLILLRKNGR